MKVYNYVFIDKYVTIDTRSQSEGLECLIQIPNEGQKRSFFNMRISLLFYNHKGGSPQKHHKNSKPTFNNILQFAHQNTNSLTGRDPKKIDPNASHSIGDLGDKHTVPVLTIHLAFLAILRYMGQKRREEKSPKLVTTVQVGKWGVLKN